MIGSDNEGDFFLTEEEQGLFSSDQTEKNYQDSKYYQLGFENAIMEVHRKYDLRSKKNQEISKNNKLDIVVRKTPENNRKRIADSTNTMAKKYDRNRDKTSQPSGDTSCPSAFASGPEKNILSKVPNQYQQTKLVEKIMADKTDVNMPKMQVPFNFEGSDC